MLHHGLNDTGVGPVTVPALGATTSWWQSRRVSRVQAWKKATETISDRAIIETEENNDTFTVDARYVL